MKLILSALGATALLAGCVTSTPTPYAGCVTWDQQGMQPHLAAVSVLSPELARVIGVREVSTSRTATGMAAVQTTIQNCTDVDAVLIVRTRFSGDRGQTESPSAWKTVHMAPRSTNIYAESAIHPGSSRVQVEIHDANRGQAQFAPGQSYVPTAPQR